MLIGCCGLPGSASTWTYNVVHEILRRGGRAVAAGSIENMNALSELDLSKVDTLAMKAHAMDHKLMDVLNLSKSRILLSLRDPIDCAVSIRSRILSDEIDAIKNIVRSFASIASLAAYCDCLPLHFEDDFPAKLETVREIADYLGVVLSSVAAKNIFNQFEKGALGHFLHGVAETGEVSDKGFRFDRRTLFNEQHFTKVEKPFAPARREELERLFGAFQGRRDGLHAGARMTFSERIFYFDAPWPRREGLGVKVLNSVYLPRGEWEIAVGGKLEGAKIANVIVCQSGRIVAQRAAEGGPGARCEFRLENLSFDDDLQVFVEGDIPYSFEPDRPDAFQMEAVLSRFPERCG